MADFCFHLIFPVKYHFNYMRFLLGCNFYVYRLFTFKTYSYLYKGSLSLPTSKMEFFARLSNSWKPLIINYCLNEYHLDVVGFLNSPLIIREL